MLYVVLKQIICIYRIIISSNVLHIDMQNLGNMFECLANRSLFHIGKCNHFFERSWHIFQSTCHVQAGSNQCIMISTTRCLGVFQFFEQFLGCALQNILANNSVTYAMSLWQVNLFRHNVNAFKSFQ